jgi:hypothetical protein
LGTKLDWLTSRLLAPRAWPWATLVVAALLAACAAEEPPGSSVTLPPVAPWDSSFVNIDFERGRGSILLAESADLTCSPPVRADGPTNWWTFSFGTDERVLDVECLQTGMPHGIKFRVASSGEVDCPNASAQRVESWGVTCEFEGAGVLDVVEFNVYERK